MKYEVNWKEIWSSLAKLLFLSIVFPVAALFVLRWFLLGFNLSKTFGHMSFLEAVAIVCGIWVVSAILAFLLAIRYKFAYITIEGGKIIGRNYWFRKKSLNLSDLQSVDFFSNDGIRAIVVDGGGSGKVFVYVQTEKIQEILETLEKHLPKQTDPTG